MLQWGCFLVFPQKSFDYVQDLQPSINTLIDKISRNRPFYGII